MRRLFVTAVAAVACSVPAAADETEPKAAPFAVYPIATELQRVRLARSDDEAPRLRAYVAISGNELIDGEGAMKPGTLPADDIVKALAPYSDRNAGIVRLNMHFGNRADGGFKSPSSAADKDLRSSLENMGRTAGFKSAIVASSLGGDVLEKKFGEVTDKVKGRADEAETPSGDALVTVYPVRTILSLLLTNNADCVIVIRTPLEQDGDNLLSPEIREAIDKHFAKVKLRDKEKLEVSIKTRGNRISYDRLDKFIRVEMAELSKSLGFTSVSLQRSFAN